MQKSIHTEDLRPGVNYLFLCLASKQHGYEKLWLYKGSVNRRGSLTLTMQWRTQQGQGFQILLDFCVTADVGQDPSDRAEKEGGERQGFQGGWLWGRVSSLQPGSKKNNSGAHGLFHRRRMQTSGYRNRCWGGFEAFLYFRVMESQQRDLIFLNSQFFI